MEGQRNATFNFYSLGKTPWSDPKPLLVNLSVCEVCRGGGTAQIKEGVVNFEIMGGGVTQKGKNQILAICLGIPALKRLVF